MLGSLLSIGIGAGRSNAANPNGFSAPSWIGKALGNLDPIGNWITSVGGDPLNLYGNKNNPNALFFPGPNSQDTGQGTPVPIGSGLNPSQLSQLSQSYNTFLSNLGAGNTPMLPVGNTSAAASGAPMSGQISLGVGGTPYSSLALPGGGGNPALGSPSGSALSRSQIRGGNTGPTGVTEPSDPAFLSQLHNGMMSMLKAQGQGLPDIGTMKALSGSRLGSRNWNFGPY